MTGTHPTIDDEVARYLRTGATDPYHRAWSGGHYVARARQAHRDLREGLVREVRRLAVDRSTPPLPHRDTVGLARRKVEPMVRGLFSRAEQEIVLAMLERSIVFLTSDNIEDLLRAQEFDHGAWDLANLYLGSIGAELLGDDAPRIVGLSEGTTCFVSSTYFSEEDPFADFVVHEAAHVFHNCKRETLSLRATRTREWLLGIEFRMRETFAYSCEAYARVLERSKGPPERRALAREFAASAQIPDERVMSAEVVDIVQEAAVARNGWKVILARCAAGLRSCATSGVLTTT